LFAAIVGARHAAPNAPASMQTNEFGKIVEDVWCKIPVHFPLIELDEFVVIPNHFHVITILDDPCRGVRPDAHTGLLHILRDEKSYAYIVEYTANNPAQREQDPSFVP
jgi:hypothetical protein